ncbi:histidine kinase [Streptomyces zingiberis]|uniref:histidine kinase n=1 Tax=Streptomyces zingiberis TaxID=2053010 RepID=UPI0028931EC4|nr:histidine kinase [Streptomyces zingiberis]
MNDSTRPVQTPAPSAWPESRFFQELWHSYKEGLLTDVWAYRPLPPGGTSRRRGWLGTAWRGARWLPHATVSVYAFFLLVADSSASYLSGFPLLVAAVQVAPLLLALSRPLGAWWVSLGVTCFLFMARDWIGPGFLALPVVMILVALRSRPRVAVEMWVTAMAALTLITLLGLGRDGYVVLPFAFFTACALGTVMALRGWSLARGRVEEQETLVADVRGRHTVLEERARIARELHDVVAHHMSVIAIQAEAAPYRVANPPEELTRSFGTIRQSAVEALSELRRVLGVLRYEGADSLGVPDAPQPDLSRLDELIQGVREVGLEVEILRMGSQRPLPQGVELSAYRIVQEALSNALRHAPGSRVRVELAYVLTGLGLRVVNTEPGSPAPPSPGVGHGVTGMRERAVMLGGELTAGPTEDGGYEVTAFLPAAPVTEEEAEAEAGAAPGGERYEAPTRGGRRAEPADAPPRGAGWRSATTGASVDGGGSARRAGVPESPVGSSPGAPVDLAKDGGHAGPGRPSPGPPRTGGSATAEVTDVTDAAGAADSVRAREVTEAVDARSRAEKAEKAEKPGAADPGNAADATGARDAAPPTDAARAADAAPATDAARAADAAPATDANPRAAGPSRPAGDRP